MVVGYLASQLYGATWYLLGDLDIGSLLNQDLDWCCSISGNVEEPSTTRHAHVYSVAYEKP